MAEDWIDSVLAFWFGEIGADFWFKGSNELDEKIRQRFGALYDRLSKKVPEAATTDARAALATVIVFDQFPRNMFRGTAKAFATDDQALRIAREAVEKEFDEELSPLEKQFLYMPFQHSEVSADQEQSVMLFKALGNEEALRYAVEHRDIIQRFGRFPHRNRALDRTGSREEEAFLAEHRGYGQ